MTDTAAKLAKLARMQAEYKTMMAQKRTEKPKEPTEFQKRIQHYADEIMALTSREDRAAALLKLPADCRGWVEAEVRIRFDARKRG